jgi:putative transposase
LRYPYITRKVVAKVRELMIVLLNGKAKELRWNIIALEVMPDHVYQFIGVNSHVAPNQMINAPKGYTLRIVRQEIPHLLKLPTLWTCSFFVSTAANVPHTMIENYIA